jgi:hypothetical protein
MNERIKQLWNEAAKLESDTSWEGQTKFMEKFAELIVRECIERVGRQYTPVRDSTIEGRSNPFFPDLRVRTEYEQGIVKCGVDSVTALYELIQESTDRWYKENILRDEE